MLLHVESHMLLHVSMSHVVTFFNVTCCYMFQYHMLLHVESHMLLHVSMSHFVTCFNITCCYMLLHVATFCMLHVVTC